MSYELDDGFPADVDGNVAEVALFLAEVFEKDCRFCPVARTELDEVEELIAEMGGEEKRALLSRRISISQPVR